MTTSRKSLDLTAVMRLGELGDQITPFALRAACDLRVADLLANGPRTVAELAEAAGAHAGALLRLLRALAARGVFTEVADATFALTPLAEPLRGDHPMSLRDSFTLLESDVRAWGAMGHTLLTGEPAFSHVHGQDYWTYLADHPQESNRVDDWMRSVNRLHLRTVLGAYPWRRFGTLVDVGGGTGGFLAGLLARFPAVRGVLFDLPHVVSGAAPVLAAAGVADRCDVVPGDVFDAVPVGGDGYLLKTVLPGFDDDDVVRILRNVRDAMRPDSRLVLLEAVLPAGDTFDMAKLFDVHAMVLTGGAHRGAEQTGRLLEQVGLRLTQVVGTPTLTVLEALPAD
ncbi:methyltransferase [Micromonospora sp. HNM0581]|uniref:methyltransferase n=1 Tax=Micromonospora sp. HNM0581 TaxID=2716341 RepID=UPI00146BB779|nr:methyltransferase [Micromonospora sp. HNM0581]NLU78274.1 methyltransferase [Micromonospora sp. HNM0581]